MVDQFMEQKKNKFHNVQYEIKARKKSLEINVYKKLVNLLNKKGDKVKASQMINYALFSLTKKTGYTFSYLVWKIFRKTFTRVEARNVTIKGRSHIVPFLITHNRRIYLATKWILKAIQERKKKKGIISIIIDVLLQLSFRKRSKVLEYKEKNYKAVLANRSNLHFRW